jgi:hypothetical protein
MMFAMREVNSFLENAGAESLLMRVSGYRNVPGKSTVVLRTIPV